MTTRKQQLFAARQRSAGTTVVPPTVQFKLDRKKGAFKPLSSEDKMKCALRKVLTSMSDEDENRCRYYIDSNIKIVRAPVSTTGKAGEAQSYRAAGMCRVGVCHPEGHKSSKVIQFDISFRDDKDDRGLPDITYMDPTTIDELPKNTPIDTSML